MLKFFLFFLYVSLLSCNSEINVETLDDSGIDSVSPILSISGLTLNEGSIDTIQKITFSLNKISNEDTIIELSASDISTTNSTDYIFSNSLVTIPAGELSASIDVTVVANSTGEIDEELSLGISSDSGVVLPSSSVNVTIIDDDPFLVSVISQYPTVGENWGDFVGIINGGERRKVVIPGTNSCSGLTATDLLSVFEWHCSESESPVFFYSSGFKSKKGLANLIETDGSNYKQNSISVLDTDSKIIAYSDLEIWWSNNLSIVALNSGGGDPLLTLNSSNTVYVQTASGPSRGILLDGDGISYIMLPGVSLSSVGAGVHDCDVMSGGSQLCLMAVECVQNGAHIEGRFIGDSGQASVLKICNESGMALHNVHLNNIAIDANSSPVGLETEFWSQSVFAKNIKISNFSQYGLRLNGKNFHVDGLDISGGIVGLSVESQAWYGRFKNVNVHGASNTGVGVSGWNNTFFNMKISNTAAGYSNSGRGNVLLKALVNNTDSDALKVQTSFGQDSLISTVTSAQNSDSAFNCIASDPSIPPIVHNSVFTESVTGILSDKTVHFEDIISTNNTLGINIHGSGDDLKFSGELVLGSNGTDCQLTSSGVNIGLVNNANCENQGISDASFTYGESLVNYFMGKTTDTENIHGTTTAVGSISDWDNFENNNRTWTIDSITPLLDSSQRGSCVTDGTCMIFDWSLTGLATKMFEANGSFSEGDICPTKIHGDITFSFFTQGNFLKNAFEILNDEVGNDDGLCQSDEACIFSKNRGFDQGSGTLKSCVFQDGVGGSAVTGVKMYSY